LSDTVTITGNFKGHSRIFQVFADLDAGAAGAAARREGFPRLPQSAQKTSQLSPLKFLRMVIGASNKATRGHWSF
jgi:hypothetical protein